MSSWPDTIAEYFYRLAASGWVPRRLFINRLPESETLQPTTGPLKLEVVSHCWKYAHFLAYQLSSLVLYPPKDLSVRMTVFYCEDDPATRDVVRFFDQQHANNVCWNWRPLEKNRLFRRAIGRNLAAVESQADWVWFTDCDQVFHQDCLDSLANELQGRSDPLVYPCCVYRTELLENDADLLQAASGQAKVIDIDTRQFFACRHNRAVGALQIVHGDIARRYGYCQSTPYYQKPMPHWCKCTEDRVYRWLLGTHGTPIDIPGLFRIEHAHKGRYDANRRTQPLRSFVRTRLMEPIRQRADALPDRAPSQAVDREKRVA
ncbi:MAG: glycosyltransferase family 2 protein [Planctomycetales bacterium]|nr:glycosyltransferase family 2 protein [Planctomycetales bacterium]